MEIPQTNVQNSEGQTTGLLSTTFEGQQDTLTRRCSTSSARSGRSHVTIVEEHSKVPVLDRKVIQRRQTQVVEIKISRWSCFWGALFAPGIAERAAVATIRTPDEDDEDGDFDDKEDPYVLSVHVLSAKAQSQVHQQARCTFDTGCSQGNIVSKSFAQKLGYSERDYKSLSSREKHGGISATGQTHIPEGALHLTWYHNTSSALFRDMRFLVSSIQECDIVIGAPSIVKHKLLSKPNFASQQKGGISFPNLPAEDKDYDNLRSKAKDLRDKLTTKKHERSKERDEGEIEKLDKRIESLEGRLATADSKVEQYLAKKNSKENPDSGPSKDKKIPAPKESEKPQMNVQEPGGKTRSATGFSSNFGGLSRRKP